MLGEIKQNTRIIVRVAFLFYIFIYESGQLDHFFMYELYDCLKKMLILILQDN